MTTEPLSDEQVGSFLGSLYPTGEHAYLHNPTQTWFSALLGNVPGSLPSEWSNEGEKKKAMAMAALLRRIADGLDRNAMKQKV